MIPEVMEGVESLMPYKDPNDQRQYAREWEAKRRKSWFRGKVCVRCESSTDLELDRIDPTTKVSHRIWSWSETRREAELLKCQVLCNPCHKRKTKDCQEYADTAGEKNGQAKLTEREVSEIRRLTAVSTYRQLGQQFGVHRTTIGKIVRGERWK